MSIPKEPRQLMINLMYLVLTALLALNVSAEILNAFNLVNKGIGDSNQILVDKNASLVAGIESIAKTDARENTQKVLANAQSIQKVSQEFYEYVEGIKTEITTLAGGWIESHGMTKLKTEGEMEKTSRLLVKEGKGDELKTEIEEAMALFASVMPPGSSIQLPLNIAEVPESAGGKSWSEYNFDRVPAIAVLTILTKIQQDAKSSENAMMEVLAKSINATDFKIDKMAAKVVAPTAYVRSGNEYTADIFVAATSEQAKPEVFLGSFTGAVKKDEASGDYDVIEGKDMPLSGARQIDVVNGMGKIKEVASGTRDYQGVVRMAVPNMPDTYKYYPFEFGYETFEVGGAVVSASAMNVLYIGIDNPIKISVPGYTSDKVTASGCGIGKVKGEEYMARPTTVGLDKITVNVQTPEGGKTYPSEFRVKRIPDPYAYCGSSKGGTMKIGEFKITEKLDAKNTDFVFQVPYTITGFEMLYAPKGGGGVVSEVSGNGKFTSGMMQIRTKAKPGDAIVFPTVSVKMPDNTTRQISLSFKLIGG